jgi:hypothetical protein
MSRYRIPRNPDCPLSKTEREVLLGILEDLELEAYHPYKHESGGFSEVKVWKYDEDTVYVVIKSGVENAGDGVTYTETHYIDREELIQK